MADRMDEISPEEEKRILADAVYRTRCEKGNIFLERIRSEYSQIKGKKRRSAVHSFAEVPVFTCRQALRIYKKVDFEQMVFAMCYWEDEARESLLRWINPRTLLPVLGEMKEILQREGSMTEDQEAADITEEILNVSMTG